MFGQGWSFTAIFKKKKKLPFDHAGGKLLSMEASVLIYGRRTSKREKKERTSGAAKTAPFEKRVFRGTSANEKYCLIDLILGEAGWNGTCPKNDARDSREKRDGTRWKDAFADDQ